MYWSFWLISVLNCPFGNIFCSRRFTLAFLCRPWVNREGKREDYLLLGPYKIIKNQHIVKLWVNFPKIFFNLWKVTNKVNFLSDRWLHHFVATLPLTVVSPYSPRFLALVNNTIRCENFCRVNVGSTRGRCGADVESMWGRWGVDVGSM